MKLKALFHHLLASAVLYFVLMLTFRETPWFSDFVKNCCILVGIKVAWIQMVKNYGKHELSFVLKFGRLFLPRVTFWPHGFSSLDSFVSLRSLSKLLRMDAIKQQIDIWRHWIEAKSAFCAVGTFWDSKNLDIVLSIGMVGSSKPNIHVQLHMILK